MTVIVVLFVLLAVLAVYLFLRKPEFGRAPSGKRLERMKRSMNYKQGQFQNLSSTPTLTEGVSFYQAFREFFFSPSKRKKPLEMVPSQKTNLHKLQPNENSLIWFGHSSYFLQLEGKKILVDPVLSGHASPVKFTTRSFGGSDVYTADDIPAIDYLFITHDHWDHLDYTTVVKLKPRIGKIITGLGVGAHLEHWGFAPEKIIENDWDETVVLDDGFVVHTAPTRHFSGRGLRRNGTLWLSFILITPNHRIYFGGDSGYDTHFANIGSKYGPFDLAILENGQYDKNWKYIHMMPEEVLKAAQDLKAGKLLPVHWSKFALANHDWDDPIIRLSAAGSDHPTTILTPLIGERVNIDVTTPSMDQWWLSYR